MHGPRDVPKNLADTLPGYLQIMQKLAANRSPYFAWSAIRLCIKHNKEFPDWVVEYLRQCAERMCAERMQSERPTDVRKAFPWIFGFPKNERGPGGLFDQDGEWLKEVQKSMFILGFIIELWLGKKPVTARGDAANAVFGGDKIVDDNTLQRWLREEFQIKNLPPTRAGWAPMADDKCFLSVMKKLLDTIS